MFGGTFLGMMRRRGDGTVGLGANKHSPLESSESFEGSLPRDAEFELVDVTASQSVLCSFSLGTSSDLDTSSKTHCEEKNTRLQQS